MKTQRKIKLTLEQAREMYGKNESLDKMLLANFPELGVKKVVKWEDLGEISGWFVNVNCSIKEMLRLNTNFVSNRNVFATESQAKSALAMAQLSQLMKNVNGDWVADWSDGNNVKYTIRRCGFVVEENQAGHIYYFLSFPTAAIRDQFLSDHIELIKTYFEL